jgi:hypothetical protein
MIRAWLKRMRARRDLQRMRDREFASFRCEQFRRRRAAALKATRGDDVA